MSETLDILKKQHRAIADYEAQRERTLGPRGKESIRELRRIVTAHREAWKAAGGKPEDFLLAGILEEKPTQTKASRQAAKGE